MKLENSIIPVHKQTENLQRLQENVEKTLSCLDHVISYYHVAKDTEKIIKEGWVQQLGLAGELHPIDLLGQREVGADSAHLQCSLYPSHVIPSHQSSRRLPDLNISNPQRAKSAQALYSRFAIWSSLVASLLCSFHKSSFCPGRNCTGVARSAVKTEFMISSYPERRELEFSVLFSPGVRSGAYLVFSFFGLRGTAF